MNLSKELRIYAVGLLIGLGGCASLDTKFWPPAPGTPTKVIYVSLDTWHAMIAFPQKREQDQQGGAPPVHSTTPAPQQPAFEEWGYAERAWYVEGRQGVSGVLRALFWPSEGVVEVAGHDHVWAQRTPQPPSDLFKFRVSREGYQRLRNYLRSTITSSEPIEMIQGSRFYQATHAYHLFHHCHKYVARALQEADLPVSTFWAFNRTNLAFQLQQAEELVNQEQRR